MHGPIGQSEVGGEVAEQVERQRRRRQQVGPQPLVVEALTRLDERGAGPGRVQRGGREEVRAGVAGVVERQPAPHRPDPGVAGLRDDRLGADRMPVGFAPSGLVIAGLRGGMRSSPAGAGI